MHAKKTKIAIVAVLFVAAYAGLVLARLTVERRHCDVCFAWMRAELQNPNWTVV